MSIGMGVALGLAVLFLGGGGYVAFSLVDRLLTVREHADARQQAEAARQALAWEEEQAAMRMKRAALAADAEQARRLSEALPEDIVAVLNEESEKWYRDELEAEYRRRYTRLGDWNMVRASIGIGSIG